MPEEHDILVAFVGAEATEWVDERIVHWVREMNLAPDRVLVMDWPHPDVGLLERAQVVVTLGVDAYKDLLGMESVVLAKVRGQWTNWRGVPVLPTYHPSYLSIKNYSPTLMIMVGEDLRRVTDYLRRDTRRAPRPFLQSGVAPQAASQVGPLYPHLYRAPR